MTYFTVDQDAELDVRSWHFATLGRLTELSLLGVQPTTLIRVNGPIDPDTAVRVPSVDHPAEPGVIVAQVNMKRASALTTA